jgi:hypothetical protein
MPWIKDERLSSLLKEMDLLESPQDCDDCGAKPGECHMPGCDNEYCSVCGDQRLICDCEGHDPGFARWTGFMPGTLEALAFGLVAHNNKTYVADVGEFMVKWRRLFFIKPNPPEPPVADAPLEEL